MNPLTYRKGIEENVKARVHSVNKENIEEYNGGIRQHLCGSLSFCEGLNPI